MIYKKRYTGQFENKTTWFFEVAYSIMNKYFQTTITLLIMLVDLTNCYIFSCLSYNCDPETLQEMQRR